MKFAAFVNDGDSVLMKVLLGLLEEYRTSIYLENADI
jgi:hypothetical protein